MNDVFSGYLEKLGSNFLIAAMIPSLGLVVAVLTIFDPILGSSLLFQNQSGIYQLVGLGLLVLIPTVIVGFTLTALNTYILKFFEGYVVYRHIPFLIPFLRERQRRQAQKLIRRIDTLEKRINVLENWKDKTPRLNKVLARLKSDHYATAAFYDKNYPPKLEQILPTQFGNILRASEAYSGTRYGIDGVEFWPRLIHVIPPTYQESIDGSRNELSFLVNMSILALIYFFLCLLAIFYNIGVQAFSQTPNGSVAILNAGRYTLAGLIALICVFFFQRASIFSVSTFGVMIRGAYDLFRLDLLKQFHLKMPKDSYTEFFMWKNLGELIILGDRSLSFGGLEYQSEDLKPPAAD